MNQAPDSHPPLKRFGRLGITIDNLGSKSANVSINQAPDSHLPFKWFGRLRIPYFQSTISKVNVLDGAGERIVYVLLSRVFNG